MDDGTDCLGVLTNRLLPLKQGYVAVVNRGEKANQEGMSVQGAAARERAFFVQHPKYRLHMHR
jgi:dynamin 1-like protein